MMKKIAILLVALLAMSALATTTLAAPKDRCPECDAKMGEWNETTAPTCTTTGVETRKCNSCDYSETKALDKLGHMFINYEANDDATCTMDGTETAECENGCGATDTRTDAGSALGHMFIDYEANDDATCTTDGTETAECENGCGATDTRTDAGSALGHMFIDYEANDDATCTTDGTETAECEVCGAKGTRTVKGSALGHDYRRKGHVCTCTRCGHSYKMLHYFGEWTPVDGDRHSATCMDKDCKHVAKTSCEYFAYYTLDENGNLAEEYVTVCPVCGRTSDGKVLEMVKGAKAKAIEGQLPRGEIILRAGALADGTNVISVAVEYSGKSENIIAKVCVTLPAEVITGDSLYIINELGVKEEVPFTVEDGIASFELDFTPAEGEQPVPMRILTIGE